MFIVEARTEVRASEPRTAPIFTRLVNFCWSLFQWCLLLLIAGALAVGGYLYFRLDDEIRRQVEMRLADFYRDFDVRVGSARFDDNRGISITNLTLTPKAPGENSQTLLAIQEMYMAGKMRMDQLVTGQMQIDEIVVHGAKLRMERHVDGQWNAHALLPLPHFGKESPKVKIEGASATVADAGTPASKPWAINGVNLQLTPVQSTVPGENSEKRYSLEGATTGLPAKEIQIKGEIGGSGGPFDLLITAVGLEISPELLANLPRSSSERLHGADFSGRADLVVKLARSSADAAIGWSASMRLDRGRIAHPLLPDPLTDVSLLGRADSTHLLVERLSGKCGSAIVVAALDRSGWTDNAPLGLSAKVANLRIDERLRSALPDAYARIWDRFKPAGLVDAEVKVTFDGEKWRPVLTADCRGLSLTDAEKFNYPLEQATGRIEYQPAENGGTDRLRMNLTGIGGGQPIAVQAELTHVVRSEPEGITTATGVAAAGESQSGGAHAAGYRGLHYTIGPTPAHPLGFVKIFGSDIPIHEQLLSALPDKAQALTRSLQPQGLIDFQFNAEWKDLSQPRAEVTQEIRLKDCRIQFDRFAYPLQHIHGVLKANNSHWALQDIEAQGATDNTTVKCRGEATTAPAGCNVDLTFNAQDVPLDDTLKSSLTPPGQQAWAELRPQGRVNFDAHVTKQVGEAEPIIQVILEPRDKSVSIEPRLFRYRLEKIQGKASYQRGHVDLKMITAEHGRTLYSVESGVWQSGSDGSWQIGLSNVTADRLEIGRDFLVAVPPALQSAIEQFQPSGTFGLYNSNLSFSKSPQAVGMASSWDINLECQQASIQGAVPLRGITGGVHLVGRSDGRSATAAAELAIDSLMCKDVQLTNVHGPLWSDGTHLFLGEPACQQQNQPPRRLTADAYGGSLATNIELQHDANPSYKMDLHVGGANLARFANERLGGPNDMSGTVSGALVITGTGHTMETLRGQGELHVVDGSIYQLPPLVSMLKVLRNRTPDTTAFNRCDMKFAIEGEHVQFDQLDLMGDAVSLYGKGEFDFNRKLNLVFYTLIGPADWPIPYVKTIVGHVSQQGLQLKVVGTFDHPETQRKAVPAAYDMLDHIQSGLQEGAATMSPASAARGLQAPAR